MQKVDPIFVAPRFVERDWGRSDLGDWLAQSRRTPAPVAEAWICDSANSTQAGPFGYHIARLATPMLGDLGRAPPRLRLVFPNSGLLLQSTSPVSFWSILEPGEVSRIDPVYRSGDRIRAYEGASVPLAAGSVALEVSSSFQPANEPEEGPSLIRLPPVSGRTRATLFREAGLSVERWRLPAWSRLVPDGETCHVVMALTRGVCVDGRFLHPGEAVFLPALGRAVDIAAQGSAKVLVAYPDTRPTAIWRHTPGPDPQPAMLAALSQERPLPDVRGAHIPRDKAA
jgi:hypothetical protein